ncbi:MAG: outer membrane lipoprotein carrier protein LolA [Saprospiraceae bacterium]|nr:outer membrane lipoprotein carrier protein LolA [Saprospiraceae bacterium]MDW8230714.1 outer membrane lipoprotein carrier protein LolA [Saprospiraceae bacterium]
MKKLLPLAGLLCLLFTAASAQNGKQAAEKSDPEAQKILERVRKKYEKHKTLEAEFTLTLELPDRPKEVQKGVIAQEGQKFRLEMDQQTIASDGKTTWVFLKTEKEIQITNAEPNGESGFMTPRELLNRYQKGDYLYAITEKTRDGGKALTHIEFKPVSRRSEYAKLRVSIDESAQLVERIIAFGRDGSRFTFQITRFTPDKSFKAGYFQLNPKDHPGVRVEDLRM